MKINAKQNVWLPLALAVMLSSNPNTHAATLIVTSTADSGPGTLRQALASASDGDTIDATGVSGTILLTSGELLVSNSVSILGPGPNVLAVDGNAASSVFDISSNTVVSIYSLTITNGFATETDPPANSGGGIYSDHAFLTVSNCTVSGNSGAYGGGIYNNGYGGVASLTVINCTLSGNHAGSGGGIGSYGDLSIVNSTLIGNSAATGGGIETGGSASIIPLSIVDSIISSNLATGYGGGVLNSANLNIVRSVVRLNSAHGPGGGVYNMAAAGVSAVLTISNSTLSSNSAEGNGGGAYNTANFGGSAILTIANSTISNNFAEVGFEGSSGGGFANASYSATSYSDATAVLTIVNSTLSGNYADNGGGIANISYSYNPSAEAITVLTLANSTLSDNQASSLDSASGIYNASYSYSFDDAITVATLVNNTLNGNHSSGAYYSGVYNESDAGGNAILEIGNTILEAGLNGPSLANSSGSVFSLGYNLSSDDGGGFLTATGDQINTDPMLGPLQDNGGPTLTHALLLGSPAIDKGTNFSASATDQRGQTRTYDNPGIPNAAGGDGTDIGAFEFIPPTLGIAPDYGDVILSWSTNFPGFTLESTPVLGNSATWTPVPGTPLIIGDQYLLGDGPVTGSKFYRLRSP